MIKTIKRVLAGTLIASVLAFGALVMPTTPAFADCSGTDPTLSLSGGAACSQPTGASGNLFGSDSIFTKIVNILLFIIGAVAVIMLIIGGVRYTISGGKESEVKAAKDTILYAIVGIVVAFLAYAVVNWVLTSLGA